VEGEVLNRTSSGCAKTDREQMQQHAVRGRQSYSITSSARARTVGGRLRPSALAVLRLSTSSYVVGACKIGRTRALVQRASRLTPVALHVAEMAQAGQFPVLTEIWGRSRKSGGRSQWFVGQPLPQLRKKYGAWTRWNRFEQRVLFFPYRSADKSFVFGSSDKKRD
jgi:hypothetical protein